MRLQGTQEPAQVHLRDSGLGRQVAYSRLHLPIVKQSPTAVHALCRKRLSRVVIGRIKWSSFISPLKEVTCRAFLSLTAAGLSVVMPFADVARQDESGNAGSSMCRPLSTSAHPICRPYHLYTSLEPSRQCLHQCCLCTSLPPSPARRKVPSSHKPPKQQ